MKQKTKFSNIREELKMKSKKIVSNISVYLMIFTLMIFSVYAYASPAAVNLGNADNFAILSTTGITNDGTHLTDITGDIGASGITAASMDDLYCSEITGTIYGDDEAYTGSGDVSCFSGTSLLVANAVNDQLAAYNDAIGRPVQDTRAAAPADIGGLTLAPGVYDFTGPGDVIITSDLYLDGSATDRWIFIIPGTLDISSDTSVILLGTAKADNIVWAVAGTTQLQTTSVFEGNIISGPATSTINLRTGATLNGRALGGTDVTLQGNIVVKPTVSTDIDSPVIILNTANNTVTDDNQTSLNFTFVDNESITALCSLFINGTGYNSSLLVNNNTPTLITPNASLAEGAYSWYINCTDLSDNEATSIPRIININDNTTTPILSNINSSPITYNRATITWTTNEAANSTVYYGTNSSNLSSLETDGSIATSQSIILSSLSASTLYYYNVTSCDPSGNCNTSSIYNFTTLARSSGGGGGGSSSCTSSWNCSGWNACINGKQIITCNDINKCATPTKVPTTTQSCCSERWVCSDWQPTVCPLSGEQTRTCTEINKCGTEKYKEITKQRCNYLPTTVTQPIVKPQITSPTVDQAITGSAINKGLYSPLWWVGALVLLVIIGLVIGGYFIFRNPVNHHVAKRPAL